MDAHKIYHLTLLVAAVGLAAPPARTTRGTRDFNASALFENYTSVETGTPASPTATGSAPARATTPTTISTAIPTTISTAAPTTTSTTPARPKIKIPAAEPGPQSKPDAERAKGSEGRLLMIVGVLAVVCIILLFAAAVLSCMVCRLQAQLRDASRPPPSGRADAWSPQGGKEVAGTGGAETSIMLETVKEIKDEEEEAARPDRTKEAAETEGGSGAGEDGPAKEINGGPTAAAATASEPPPPAPAAAAADPGPDKSPAPQSTPAPAAEPASDKAEVWTGPPGRDD